MPFLIQGVGLLGALFNLIAYQLNEHKKIMIFTTLNALSFTLQYFLLGAYTGMLINGIAIVRNILFAYLVAKKKNTLPATVIFSVLMIISGAVTWAGPISLLPVLGKTTETVSFSMKNAKLVRVIAFPSMLCWLTYNCITGSIGGAISDLMAITAITIGAIKDVKREKAERNNAEQTAPLERSSESETGETVAANETDETSETVAANETNAETQPETMEN